MNGVGVVGLGNIGFGIANNLLKAGHHVIGHNRGQSRRDALREAGGTPAESPAAVAAVADIVFTVLVDEQQTREAIFGPHGLLTTMKPAGIVVICSTIGQHAVMDIAAKLAPREISVIDCPVSGGRNGADAGTLTLMASGDAATFERCRLLFEAIATNINYVGSRPGLGQVVKTCMQGVVGCIYTGLFEALVLGVKAGVTPEALYQVLGTSVVNTPLLQGSYPAIMRRAFAGTGSSIGNTYKDLCLNMALATEVGATVPVTAVAHQAFQAGVVRFPGEDNQALVKLLEAIAGVEVKYSVP